MPRPEQCLRRDNLGLMLATAFDEQRSATPPTSVLRSVRLRVVAAKAPRPSAWLDSCAAPVWPCSTYFLQLLTWSALPIRNGFGL
jgi:hypothetical protein